tara:strand:+ start:40 stop:216 length:177 start_codon:yes stop_codon:yes gene_type:complete
VKNEILLIVLIFADLWLILNGSPFRIVDYNIIDLYDINVNFKAEFNTNNKEIYNLERL